MNAPATFPTQQIRNRLARWRREIERALRDTDLMTFEDIERRVLDFEAPLLLFDTDKAFAVVEIQEYSKGRIGHVLVAGGSLQGLRDLQEKALPFFRHIGARRLQMAGRQGFTRKLPAWGWKQPRVLMHLEL